MEEEEKSIATRRSARLKDKKRVNYSEFKEKEELPKITVESSSTFQVHEMKIPTPIVEDLPDFQFDSSEYPINKKWPTTTKGAEISSEKNLQTHGQQLLEDLEKEKASESVFRKKYESGTDVLLNSFSKRVRPSSFSTGEVGVEELNLFQKTDQKDEEEIKIKPFFEQVASLPGGRPDRGQSPEGITNAINVTGGGTPSFITDEETQQRFREFKHNRLKDEIRQIMRLNRIHKKEARERQKEIEKLGESSFQKDLFVSGKTSEFQKKKKKKKKEKSSHTLKKFISTNGQHY